MSTTRSTAKKNNDADHWQLVGDEHERLMKSPWRVRNAAKMGYNYKERRVEANFFYVNDVIAKNMYETQDRTIVRSYNSSYQQNIRRYGHGNLDVNTNVPWKLPRKNRRTTVTISRIGLQNLRTWRQNKEDDLLDVRPRLYRGRIIFDFVLA